MSTGVRIAPAYLLEQDDLVYEQRLETIREDMGSACRRIPSSPHHIKPLRHQHWRRDQGKQREDDEG